LMVANVLSQEYHTGDRQDQFQQMKNPHHNGRGNPK
jgi:hypothetical protein